MNVPAAVQISIFAWPVTLAFWQRGRSALLYARG